MLRTPGQSPRHLSSPSPSAISDYTPNRSSSAVVSANPNPGTYPKVLDEDTYVAVLERIIERDFFPDLEKLRDRHHWLEAVRSRDPVRIRDAQLQILERRRSKKVKSCPSSSSSCSNSNPSVDVKDPGSTFMRSSTPLDEFDAKATETTPKKPAGEGQSGNLEDSLTLDQFVRRYTSEDNESFSKILDKENRKRKERYDYLLEGENNNVKAIEDVKRDRITDGYGSSDQPPSTLESWKYTAKNLLMYHPADRGEVALTVGEKAARMKCLDKEISNVNTRFHGKMADSRPVEDAMEVLYAPVVGGTPVIMDRDGDKLKKYDLDDLRKTPNQFYVESTKKADNGYSFVKTPSPAPGVGESPIITWGEIEGTPLRLDSEDTPLDIGGSEGPHYRIPSAASRDEKAYSLSRLASRKLRERQQHLFPKPPLPSPSRAGSASPSVRTLSPAAQKLVRNAFAKNSSAVDETLRASYRGASPGLATPKGGRSVSRFGSTTKSRSPSVREGSPW